MNTLTRFTLEVSAKPFYPFDENETAEKLREMFRLWYPILKRADNPALLWWFGDGAEMLEFSGDLDRPVEWAKWMGFAHQRFNILRKEDPNAEALSGHDWLYRPDAGDITPRHMQQFMRQAREIAREVTDKELVMGIAFDPGPEFCKSVFRYEWHPELLITPPGGGAMTCIDATARLKADERPYAAFPDGVPEGTPFGTFFGRQTKEFLKQVPFDYLWFSNSFGFGRSPYAFGATGEFFDGETFSLENNTRVADEVMEFWKLFREENPEIRIACRGTDFTAGFNMISQATPYRRLYNEIPNLTPPPNTPWPALTHNHGLGIAGMLSQISVWPGSDFPYRFYLSDPWWLNSPWVDRYEGNPSDIYMNTALSRLTGDGRLDRVNEMALLSIDTSWGELPEDFPITLIPHLRRGLDESPDAPGPVVWVYPYPEFETTIFDEKTGCERVLCNDANVLQAINRGMPVSSVVTTTDLVKLLEEEPEILAGTVLLTLVPDAGSAWETALLKHAAGGGKVLCFGNTRVASEEFRAALGLAREEEILEGLKVTRVADRRLNTLQTGDYARELAPPVLISDGGVAEADAGSAKILAEAENDGEGRVLASIRDHEKGQLGWTRGISSIEGYGRQMTARDVTDCYPCETLFRHVLAEMGWSLRFEQEEPRSENYYCQIHRNRNGFLLSSYGRDTELELLVRSPWGAPLFPAMVNRIEDGHTRISFKRTAWFHDHCRVFVEGQEGRIRSSLRKGTHHVLYRKAWYLEGLENATLRIFPFADSMQNTQILLNANRHNTVGEEFDGEWQEQDGLRYLEMRGVTGDVSFMWSHDDVAMPKAVVDRRVEE